MAHSLDEFSGAGEERTAAPLNLVQTAAGVRDWQKRLAQMAKTEQLPGANELSLPAFTLIRGGDLFERAPGAALRTAPNLLNLYQGERLHLVSNQALAEEQTLAMRSVMRVLAGNPALAKRMLLAKPIHLVIIPQGRDFREFEFPPNTNPYAAGIFWSSAREPRALIGVREELIAEKPHILVHEMTHAVHFLGFTASERQDIDRLLLPVYRSQRWVEEAVAIYAERAFGARYDQDELRQPDLYGKTRREWDKRHIFARFISELMRPGP